MRSITLVLLLTGSAVFAQHGGGGFGSVLSPGTGVPVRPTNPTGFGSVLSPGTGVPPGSIPGRRGFGGAGRGFFSPPQIGHPSHGRTVIVPYPVFYGNGYYGYDPSNDYAQPAPGYDADPNYAGGYGAAPAQPPVVILNQNYRPDQANPVIRDYTNTPLPEPTMKVYDAPPSGNADTPVIYMIAMKDHTIFPAVAYWVQGDTLHYVTTEGSHNRASLDLVDREFSKQLNDERHVEFKLPASK
jgi:hypothetical protein